MRYFLLLCTGLLIFLSPASIYAQTSKPVHVQVKIKPDPDGRKNLMPYSSGRLLRVNDFKGRPDKKSDGVAATKSGIEMSFSGTEYPDRIEVVVLMYAYFEPAESWMKKEGRNARVLNHEQGHFDLTAIYLCKMKERFENYKYNPLTWGNALKALYHKITVELESVQRTYDRETRHGTLSEQQQAYDERFEQALRSHKNCY